MTIAEIYQKYQIMPQLKLHQYRVGAVAQLVCGNMQVDIDVHEIVAADLLHDMGNIIKFNLTVYPEYLQPEGFDFWNDLKQDFIERYGSDEHVATYKIAEELKVSPRILELVKAVGFSKSKQISASSDLSLKICAYADRRVSPKGVVSMEERETEGIARHLKNKGVEEDDRKFKQLFDYSVEVEKQVFAQCKIKPEGVNDETCQKVIASLASFEIA